MLFAAVLLCGCGPTAATGDPPKPPAPEAAATDAADAPAAAKTPAEVETATFFVKEMGDRLNLF